MELLVMYLLMAMMFTAGWLMASAHEREKARKNLNDVLDTVAELHEIRIRVPEPYNTEKGEV